MVWVKRQQRYQPPLPLGVDIPILLNCGGSTPCYWATLRRPANPTHTGHCGHAGNSSIVGCVLWDKTFLRVFFFVTIKKIWQHIFFSLWFVDDILKVCSRMFSLPLTQTVSSKASYNLFPKGRVILKKTANYPLLVDKRFTPPPLSTFAKLIIFTLGKFFIHIWWPPPLALIHFYWN